MLLAGNLDGLHLSRESFMSCKFIHSLDTLAFFPTLSYIFDLPGPWWKVVPGRVHIYRDGNGVGDFLEMLPGTIFGEQPFRRIKGRW